jgi:integrase
VFFQEDVMTIAELIDRHLAWASRRYRKGDRPTSQVRVIRSSLEPLRALSGTDPARDYSPVALMGLIETYVERGFRRESISGHLGRVKGLFRWAKIRRLIPPQTYLDLVEVESLHKGELTEEGKAPVESAPILPASDQDIEAMMAHLDPVTADMVRVQLATACRPGELVVLRWDDIQRSGEVWRWLPWRHKTEHLDVTRVIPIGPTGQAVLNKYRHFVNCQFGIREETYRRRLNSACRRAGVPEINPHQLRHSALTKIRKLYGLDAAQAIAGHAHAQTSEIYAELSIEKALDVARQVG